MQNNCIKNYEYDTTGYEKKNYQKTKQTNKKKTRDKITPITVTKFMIKNCGNVQPHYF